MAEPGTNLIELGKYVLPQEILASNLKNPTNRVTLEKPNLTADYMDLDKFALGLGIGTSTQHPSFITTHWRTHFGPLEIANWKTDTTIIPAFGLALRRPEIDELPDPKYPADMHKSFVNALLYVNPKPVGEEVFQAGVKKIAEGYVGRGENYPWAPERWMWTKEVNVMMAGGTAGFIIGFGIALFGGTPQSIIAMPIGALAGGKLGFDGQRAYEEHKQNKIPELANFLGDSHAREFLLHLRAHIDRVTVQTRLWDALPEVLGEGGVNGLTPEQFLELFPEVYRRSKHLPDQILKTNQGGELVFKAPILEGSPLWRMSRVFNVLRVERDQEELVAGLVDDYVGDPPRSTTHTFRLLGDL